jgi:hypothetical protein
MRHGFAAPEDVFLEMLIVVSNEGPYAAEMMMPGHYDYHVRCTARVIFAR